MGNMTRYSEQPITIGKIFTQIPLGVYCVNMPVRMPETGFRLPDNLSSLWALLDMVRRYTVRNLNREFEKDYYYVTAYRGQFIPAIRTGWHCDGFGTKDANFLYWTGLDMKFIGQLFFAVSKDHIKAKTLFNRHIRKENIFSPEEGRLYYISPHTVYRTPETAPIETTKQLIRISVSTERYNLEGNDKNSLFDYNWPVYSKAAVIEDPQRASRDYY